MKGVKCIGLLALFTTLFLSLSLSQNVNATSITSATVDFYAGQQINATVNLPWTVNPGNHRFFLNHFYLDTSQYNGQKLAYVAGRAVMQIEPYTINQNFYVCGNVFSDSGPFTAVPGYCLGQVSIVYSDNSQTTKNDIPVYYNSVVTTNDYNINIYFDFNTELEATKTVSFIQFHFYAASGYDVISQNTNWNNSTLMVVVEGRYSMSVYDTPPSGMDIANDLLQQQIGQNDTIITQNQETYNYLTDNTPPSADTSSLSGSAGWLPAGPVDSILTLPVTFAQGIVNVFTGQHQCSPIVLPLAIGPYNYNLTIPCLDEYFRISQISILWNAVGTIISAFVIYETLKWLYKFVDETLSFRENNSGMWGGL